MSDDALKTQIKNQLLDLGFDAVGFTKPSAISSASSDLKAFLQAGYHGTMEWMVTRADWRADPCALWPEARTIIVAAMNYGPTESPLEILKDRSKGAISVYAQNKDYHDVLKKRLKQVARWLHQDRGADVKVFVDTAPVMEKPLAQAAGLGWQGKHTNLVSQRYGSWLFLGSIFTTLDVSSDTADQDHCGSCSACLDACPTHAFPSPYRLDARRCISYLTIEHKGNIPRPLRAAIGSRIYGCDDCLAVCPWNKFAQAAQEIAFHGRDGLKAPDLAALSQLDDGAFRTLFSGSPVKRIGRNRFIRNVLIAIGNSRDIRLLPSAEQHLTDPAPVVRSMAVWAVGQLAEGDYFNALKERYFDQETDSLVRSEWGW